VLSVPDEGLEPRADGGRKRVVVIGAGLAGLVAAFELERRGHEALVLEAQNRVGGRIHTLRDFAPGLYAEAGGMRIPAVHELTLAYCRSFGLSLRPFVMDNPRTYVYLAGRRMRYEEADRDPSRLPFALAGHERGRTYLELWNEATREIRELYEREGDVALARIGEQYGGSSLRDFLRSRGFSEGAIELYGIMSFREANMGASVVEQLREIVGRAFEDMQEIEGGMDQLPQAFYRRLAGRVHFGAHVHAVEQDEASVTVRYRTHAGEFSATGDHAVCTLPFGLLRHVDFHPALTLGKYRAIRSLNYNPSTKILLQFRRRFWEQDDGIVGGTTATDLPIRRIVYPSHGEPGEERGILLASYTWGQDAARWGALSPDDRIALALKDVAKIHPQAPSSSRPERPTPGTATRTPAGPSRCSSPARRARSTPTSSGPKGACTSPASTARCGMLGSRARSRRESVPRAPSTSLRRRGARRRAAARVGDAARSSGARPGATAPERDPSGRVGAHGGRADARPAHRRARPAHRGRGGAGPRRLGPGDRGRHLPAGRGLTVVAYGTSAPELAVGVQAGLNGQPGIALGNVIGSNVFNVLFVLGLCALITPLVVKQELVRRDVPVMIGVSAGLIVVALSGSVSRVEGLVLLAGVVLYSTWVIRASRAAPDEPAEEDAAPPAAIRVPRNLGLVVAGLAMLVLGGRWLVDGAVEIAEVLGLSEVVIG
jgi:monoamine oxidase